MTGNNVPGASASGDDESAVEAMPDRPGDDDMTPVQVEGQYITKTYKDGDDCEECGSNILGVMVVGDRKTHVEDRAHPMCKEHYQEFMEQHDLTKEDVDFRPVVEL